MDRKVKWDTTPLCTSDTECCSEGTECCSEGCYFTCTITTYVLLLVFIIGVFVWAIVLAAGYANYQSLYFISISSLVALSVMIVVLLVIGGVYLWYLYKWYNSREKKFGSELTNMGSEKIDEDPNLNESDGEAKHQKILLYLFISGFLLVVPWFIGSVLYTKDRRKVYLWCNRIAAMLALLTVGAVVCALLISEVVFFILRNCCDE